MGTTNLDQAEAAIRDLVADASTHQNDPAPFLALHTDDAVVVNFVGIRVLGRRDRNADSSESGSSSTGTLTYVVVRDDDAWRIALAQTTPALAAPSRLQS